MENNKWWQGGEEIGILVHCRWEGKCSHCGKQALLPKPNLKLPSDPAVLFLRIYLEEPKPGSQIDACTLVFVAADNDLS